MADNTFGPNEWLVEEMYDRYKADPSSVGPSWQEFFSNYRQSTAPPRSAAATATAPAPPAPAPTNGAATPAPAAAPALPAEPAGDAPRALKGPAARIVTNMEASLGVPTATSVRRIPAKLLELNRKIL